MDRVRHILATSTNVEEVKIAQSVLLPSLGLSLEQTAEVLGKERHWVSRVRNRFIRGEDIAPHGGRRNAYMSEKQERELVEAVLSKVDTRWRPRPEERIRRLLASRLTVVTKMPVSDKMVTDVLDRYARQHVPGASWGSLRNFQTALVDLARASYESRMKAKKSRAAP